MPPSTSSDSSLEKQASEDVQQIPLPASAAPAPTSAVGDVVQSSGVTRMEAVYREARLRKANFYIIGASVLVCAWAYSLDGSTTSFYGVYAASYYQQHSSILSTVSIATNIIGAVAKPFIAKISDITSRPYTYLLALCFYAVGYIIAAASNGISAYVTGEVFVAIGSAGLDLTNDIIVADLTPLEWRGFISSLLSSPFIINTWFSGQIVGALSGPGEWRWGYGMFAIIMPAALGPAILSLVWLDRKAKKAGLVNMASSNAARRAAQELAEKEGHAVPRGIIVAPAAKPNETWPQAARRVLDEIDALGLILLGFAWTLLLLPFSLRTYAAGGWRNPSMIAMMVVGGVLLICYAVYEIKWARYPSMPKRLLFNKTFTMAIIIDSTYFIAGNLRSLYWSSYVLIAKPWPYQHWVYYSNSLTLALCIFGIMAGLIQRWTHRYKMLQLFGLAIKVVGIGIMLDGRRATLNTGALVMSNILIGAGGAFSVVGSRVASQASVPHQDVALAISMLSLWSRIGAAIGSAIVAVIWAGQMPAQLTANLPADISAADRRRIFNDFKAVRDLYEFGSPVREGTIEAARISLFYCVAPALGIAFVPLIAACFQTNFYLGKRQNAVTNVGNDGLPVEDENMDQNARDAPTSRKEAFLKFWAGRKR